MKELINIKNNDNECFLRSHSEKITKAYKNVVNNRDYIDKLISINLLKYSLKSMIIAKNILKKCFRKNLVMSEEVEKRF